MLVNRQINGKEILPKKEGIRTLVYPACGIDNPWIEFLDPDTFIGIDKEELCENNNNPFEFSGRKTKLVLYAPKDARGTVPKIPTSDEVVLLIKCFDWIGIPDCCMYGGGNLHPRKMTQELWERYQKENLDCLRRYLQKCEESAIKKSFVIDFDGYEPVITSHGYNKVLSLTPTVDCYGNVYDFCNAKPCEKAEPLFSWNEREKNMRGFACVNANRTIIITEHDSGDYHFYPSVPILVTYLKEK